MERAAAENLLADAGLMGVTVSMAEAAGELLGEAVAAGMGGEVVGPRPSEAAADVCGGWLFSSQQMRMSLEQMDTYETHRSEAEGLDEDFVDNFS